MIEQLPNRPGCGSVYVYEDCGLFICPEYGHEWLPTEEVVEEGLVVKDSSGNLLADGDSATVIEDLKVKGASSAIKQGIKVKNVRLAEGDCNTDCRVDSFDSMKLKSEPVKRN